MESIIQLEAVAVQVAEAPIETVQHVLFVKGDGLGTNGGPFVNALLRAIDNAGAEERLKLSLVFPHHVNLWRASRETWSHELLRDRAKAALA